MRLKKRQKEIKKNATGVGIIKIHPRGFGFVLPDNRDVYPEDIFIPKRWVLNAVDGDRVEVSVYPSRFSNKGPEGKVLKILERGRTHLAGTITYAAQKKQIYAYAPLLGEDQPIRILTPKRSLKPGDRIIIHVLEWGSKKKECLGEMSAYIGHISDPSLDLVAAVEEFELGDSFSEQVLQEAKSFGQSIPAEELKKREDLRHLECITIDPDTAKDFDDAVSLTKDKKGNFHLGVHIADVSHYVKPGSLLDKEASKRCNSIYFPGHVLPMLPHELSSHLCSLKPNVNRLAASILMRLNSHGELIDYRISRTVIKSKKRFTYKQAKEILEGKKKSKYSVQLQLMSALCGLLKKIRAKRGSIEFALPDLSIQLNEKGGVEKVELVEYDITHQLIEEFMLLTNEVVATHLSKKGKPLTYRIHEEPNPDNLRDFAHTAGLIGFKISEKPSAEELQDLFDKARGSPFGQFLATSFIRSMKLASYSTQNIGHYGLCLEHYTHFTSPIRRYIDLIVHRVLFNEIDLQQDLEKIALECSEKERHASKAEQSVIYIKKLRYLLALKSEGCDVYHAVIVAIKPGGLIFELSEILFEGFAPSPDKTFRVGDKIKVCLTEVDLVSRQTEWSLKEKYNKKLRR